jgi:MoxR-like ATPase
MKQQKRIESLLSEISKGLYEKEHLLALGILCAVAGESYFLLGLPGTAKSEVSRRLKMIFKDATSFEYLMSRFSTPDEIFGPVSIKKLKDMDTYERQVEGYLPSADVVFLDEIWKAGPAIQNSLLTVLNEKIFTNGRTKINLPMKLLVAASNEIPEVGSGLEAIWDRFILRVISESVKDENNFYKMLRGEQNVTINIPENLLITEDVFTHWQNEIQKVTVPDDIMMYLTQLRKLFSQKTESPIYVSDRRWVKIGKLLRTSAFLNDRMSVDWSDLILLRHCLWNQVEEIPFVANSIFKAKIYKESSELDTISEQLHTIRQRRVWVNTYNKGKENAELNRTKNLLYKIEEDYQLIEYKIYKGLDEFRLVNNLFVTQEDRDLIDVCIADYKNKIEKIEEIIYEQRQRFP